MAVTSTWAAGVIDRQKGVEINNRDQTSNATWASESISTHVLIWGVDATGNPQRSNQGCPKGPRPMVEAQSLIEMVPCTLVSGKSCRSSESLELSRLVQLVCPETMVPCEEMCWRDHHHLQLSKPWQLIWWWQKSSGLLSAHFSSARTAKFALIFLLAPQCQ